MAHGQAMPPCGDGHWGSSYFGVFVWSSSQVLAQSAPRPCARGQDHLSVTALPPATQLPAGRGLQMH